MFLGTSMRVYRTGRRRRRAPLLPGFDVVTHGKLAGTADASSWQSEGGQPQSAVVHPIRRRCNQVVVHSGPRVRGPSQATVGLANRLEGMTFSFSASALLSPLIRANSEGALVLGAPYVERRDLPTKELEPTVRRIEHRAVYRGLEVGEMLPLKQPHQQGTFPERTARSV